MDPFEWYIFKGYIYHETEFTRKQPQGYEKLPKNVRSQSNLISKSEQEPNMVPGQTAQISEPPQWGEIFAELCDAPCRRGRNIGIWKGSFI